MSTCHINMYFFWKQSWILQIFFSSGSINVADSILSSFPEDSLPFSVPQFANQTRVDQYTSCDGRGQEIQANFLNITSYHFMWVKCVNLYYVLMQDHF